MHRKFIILDRDGVVNEDSPDFIKSPEEWIPIPGSLEAIGTLKAAGYTVVIASNQSGLKRGLFDLKTLEAIHAKMQQTLALQGAQIDGIFFCPHHDSDNCDCRKPKPGLLHQIAAQFDIDLRTQEIPMIGDSLRDLEAAYAAGCTPILVLTGNGHKTQVNLPEHLAHIAVYADLKAAVDELLRGSPPPHGERVARSAG
ncbi:MAG: D-glycero-beta-D-manno-heptose 1,7-bisphosphate 7-phosphatase [Gammaproteobacteria bacterium]|nr:D-glycero-beta-D-manno-heptose 1,7-bisphosphate 7-phosphatase [Gammaproteobacteria bacterium]MBP9729436.1 D-glycero-beta-D-manno-heptose 1,7-bisphosphate 7-phosphatase [Gammaproteobacteria bacterium]